MAAITARSAVVDVSRSRCATSGERLISAMMFEATERASGLDNCARISVAGFFLTYGFTIMPGLATTEDQVFVAAFQGLERMFGTFEFGVNWPVIFGYLFSPIVMAVAIALHRKSGPIRGWLLAALMLTVATIAITQIFNVPLNDAITAAEAPAATDAAQVRADFREDWWRAWNLARSATAVGAFACLSWAWFVHGRTTAR
jgi:uncharacterized membrane protein